MSRQVDPEELMPQLFSSPSDVYSAFLQRAHDRGWPVGNDTVIYEFMQGFRDKGLANFASNLSHALSLDIWLGDLETTVSELWAWLCDVQPRHFKWDGIKFNSEKLRLTKAVEQSGRYGTEPFVRPVELDLLANRGIAPRYARSRHSAGLEILTASAAHPDYPPAINYDSVPAIWLSALEADISPKASWRDVLILDVANTGRLIDAPSPEVTDREIGLEASWESLEIEYYSSPTSRNL